MKENHHHYKTINILPSLFCLLDGIRNCPDFRPLEKRNAYIMSLYYTFFVLFLLFFSFSL